MAINRDGNRPIIIRKVKKTGHAAHHGGAWKVAYADFVTAMMAFFMLLWLVANPDKVQLKGLAEYFSPAPPNTTRSTTATRLPGDTPGIGGRSRRAQGDSAAAIGQQSRVAGTVGSGHGATANLPDASMRVLAEEIRIMIDASADIDAKQNVQVKADRDGLRINILDSAKRSMFREGTAEMNDFGRLTIKHIAEKLRKSGVQITLEGHTDASGGQSDANWALSGQRALAARSTMVAAGITPDRIAEVVALAGTQPVYPSQPDRPENRRITIVALAALPSLPSDVSFTF
jgi:chemotaxis protein MotB